VSAINDAGGLGLFAQGSPAAQFEGDLNVKGNIGHTGGDFKIATGSIFVALGDVSLGGADCAEEFDVTVSAQIDAGTVMVLEKSGSLQMSEQAYDRRVAGVVSGAGSFRPALILDRRKSSDCRVPVALVGKCFAKRTLPVVR